jgi:hypothetical protein
MNGPWNFADALAQIDDCRFECEAGPLANNVAYGWLRLAAKEGPEFFPGQWVWFEICAEAAGKKLTQCVHFCIVGCHMSASNDRRTWLYDLSYDPIGPWHNGAVHFTRISGDRLRLEKPAGDHP